MNLSLGCRGSLVTHRCLLLDRVTVRIVRTDSETVVSLIVVLFSSFCFNFFYRQRFYIEVHGG